MKERLSMRRLFGLMVLAVTSVVLAGCARFPEGASQITVREMTFYIEFNGPINDAYYYFVPIDVSDRIEGPVPVFPDPGVGPISDWVTGSATHFIEYHQRRYTVHRIINLQPFESELIGTPIRSTIPETGGKTLRFTIDLNLIGAAEDSVDVNIIALNRLPADGRLLDALGPLGTEYISIDIVTVRTVTNADLDYLEQSGDVLDQNRIRQPSTEITNPLDIVDWRITIDA